MAALQSGFVAEATNKFALDLHKCLANNDKFANGNLFYSPASLLIALAMTSYGSRGNTAAEILKVLHVASVSSPDLNKSMKKFIDTLNGASDENIKLLTANRLFVEKSFEILEVFKEGTREFYDAELALVDYITNVEKSREEINRWVEEKTNDKIKDLIPSGMLSSDTRLTLVNAIYFKGLWLEQFKQEGTHPESFFVSENEEIKVQMMHQEADFKYFESEKLACKILEMPYTGRKLSMVIYLPNETHGLAKLEEKLTYDNLQESLSLLDASMDEVEVFLPKFKLTQQFDLNNILSKMGAKEMFIPGKADLSGISTEPLFVSKVVHKAFVEVNEEGTEAAAATAIGVNTFSMPLPKPVFKADHPFLFLIRHNDSGAILFLGRLMRPAHEG
ncbi:leukocyte elastase inhibitor-like [Oculina patagonica]